MASKEITPVMHQRLWLLIFTFALLSSPAFSQVTGGMIQGTAIDPAGSVIPNVQISILNVATGVAREVTTNSEGLYSAPNLTAGPYQIKAVAPGFSTEVVKDITLTVGAQVTANLAMQVGTATEQVDV